MSFDPEPGLVIRYDFLWKEEQETGQEHGRKDRPCAVVVTLKADEAGSRKVLVCPITHAPPAEGETGVEIPPKVSRHLGLDHERSWIKTHQVNRLEWRQGQIPFGVTFAQKGKWTFGVLPDRISRQVIDQLRRNSQGRGLAAVNRQSD